MRRGIAIRQDETPESYGAGLRLRACMGWTNASDDRQAGPAPGGARCGTRLFAPAGSHGPERDCDAYERQEKKNLHEVRVPFTTLDHTEVPLEGLGRRSRHVTSPHVKGGRCPHSGRGVSEDREPRQ